MARLRKLTILTIEVDDPALADMGFDRRTKVSAHLLNVSLAEALRHVVRRQIHGDVLDFGGYRFSRAEIEVHGPASKASVRASLDADGDGTPDFEAARLRG